MAKIKIQQNNEDLIPSPVLTQYVYDLNGVSLETRLNNINKVEPAYTSGITVATVGGKSIKVPYVQGTQLITGTTSFNTVEAMTTSEKSFTDGEMLETKGFYTINDGGGSKYIVVTTNDASDGATLITLRDGHKAQIMVPASGIFNFRQFGAKNFEADATTDNKGPLDKYLAFITKVNEVFTLYIPGGTWCFTPTIIKLPCKIIGENSLSNLNPGKTIILPMSGSTQAFLWKCGGENVPCLDIHIENLMFSRMRYSISSMTLITGGTVYSNATCPKMLIIDNVEDCHFDGLYFSFAGNALDISNTKNTYIGYLNIRQSGEAIDGIRSVIRIGDNVSGLYIDYLNAEVISGNVFYGYGTDPNAITQFVLNDLQMEATHASTSTNISDPGYSHSVAHWFIFNGKLGSEEYPCMLNSASISNLKSYNKYGSTTYKSMAVFGHESQVPMSFIVGNLFLGGVKATGPWYLYDTKPGAFFTFNQPILSSVGAFYLNEANMPLIQSTNKKDGIAPAALLLASKVSYKSGAVSAHGLVGTNAANEEYTLYSLTGTGFKIRFYNAEGISSFTALISKQIDGTWSDYTSLTITCSGNVGWEIVTTSAFGTTAPTKIKIKGLPKFIDYYADV